jgi:hypothetical protein
MASLSAPPLNGGWVDPTKQAEYRILLGDKLAGKESAKHSQLISVKYNYKSKTASPQQKTTITPTNFSQHAYKLVIQDKAANAEQTNLTYSYDGSVDPVSQVSESEFSNLVLVFDPKRKAFVLEPVSIRLNFNLRSAPGKSQQQVAKQYPQLYTLPDEGHDSSDDGLQGAGEDDGQGTADNGNPYDYRHFLPKSTVEGEKASGQTSTTSTPDPHHIMSKATTILLAPSLPDGLKPKPKPMGKSKPQTNPLRQQTRMEKPLTGASATTSKPKPKSNRAVGMDVAVESPPADEVDMARGPDEDTGPPASASSATNIIVDGDLIIDMGSPPPTRPAFKINPRHFASNNTSANEADYDSDDEEDIEDLRLPSPAGPTGMRTNAEEVETMEVEEEEEEEEEDEAEADEEDENGGYDGGDDDDLAAEMEAAFEESAREEEQERARSQQMLQQQQRQQFPSDDESEISEEE